MLRSRLLPIALHSPLHCDVVLAFIRPGAGEQTYRIVHGKLSNECLKLPTSSC